jgi:twitching motility protein PilI
MANRQALRELQSRLAERLQAARAEGASVSWLAVRCADVNYLLPLDQAGEIFPWTSVQAVPYTQDWFLGVANLRGGLFGVVELQAYVRGAAPIQRSENVRQEARMVALNTALEINCAVMVDQLIGLRAAQAFSDVRAPDESAPAYFGNVYADAAGQKWQEINLQHLSKESTFLSIGS